MSDQNVTQIALSDNAARQLANATKTIPVLSTISPRWLVHLLQWTPVEAGIYRLNKVKNPENVLVACTSRDESELLLQVGEAIRSLRYGQVTVIVHDGEVVQIDRLERRRLNRGRGGNASSRRE